MFFCEVLDHTLLGTLSAARERSRVALGTADKHRPLRVEVLDLEVHFCFLRSVEVLQYLQGMPYAGECQVLRDIGKDTIRHVHRCLPCHVCDVLAVLGFGNRRGDKPTPAGTEPAYAVTIPGVSILDPLNAELK